jgi:hypothetical protein
MDIQVIDENNLIVDGKNVVAVIEEGVFDCEGCIFDGFLIDCGKVPDCWSDARQDKEFVIFKYASETSTADI